MTASTGQTGRPLIPPALSEGVRKWAPPVVVFIAVLTAPSVDRDY